jgi:hypothetical protein
VILKHLKYKQGGKSDGLVTIQQNMSKKHRRDKVGQSETYSTKNVEKTPM